LISGCIGPNYIRHDEAGDRTVTLEAYAAEITKPWLNLRPLRILKIETCARLSELV